MSRPIAVVGAHLALAFIFAYGLAYAAAGFVRDLFESDED